MTISEGKTGNVSIHTDTIQLDKVALDISEA
jgi:hypothetical protein